MKNLVIEILSGYFRGLGMLLLFSPAVIVTLFVAGILGKLFWLVLKFGFTLL